MARSLTNSEFKTLERNLPHFLSRDAAIISLFLYCGLRVGELIMLRHSDITYSHTTPTELHVRPSTTKTGIGRHIPIPHKAAIYLSAYIGTPPPRYNTLTPLDYIFRGSAGNPTASVHGVEQLVTRLSAPLLGRHVTPHMLRHTYATQLLKYTNTREVQLLLGHKKLSSTQIYTHPSTEDLQKAVDKAFA